MRAVWKCVTYNFSQWRGNIRIIAVFILSFILCFLLTDKIIVFIKEYQLSMQIAEAFIWTFGDSESILLSSLLLLLLFADMPFVTSATPFFLVRCSRKVWVSGQLLYIVIATTIYMVFNLLATCLLCAVYSFPKNAWSKAAAILAYSEEGKLLSVPASVKALEMGRPFECMAVILLMILLYTLTMVLLMMFANLWKGSVSGVLIALIFTSYGVLLNPNYLQALLKLPDELYYKANVMVGWLSPLNHATFHMHNFGYDKLPRIWESVLIFVILIGILIICNIRSMKKYNFQFKGTER